MNSLIVIYVLNTALDPDPPDAPDLALILEEESFIS